MKRLVLGIVFILGAMNIMAQSSASSLIVESTNGETFILKVDGFVKNKKPAKKVRVNDIYAKGVNISIIFADSTLAPVKNMPVAVVREMGKDESTVTRGFNAYYKVTAKAKKSTLKKVSITPKESPKEAYTPSKISKKEAKQIREMSRHNQQRNNNNRSRRR